MQEKIGIPACFSSGEKLKHDPTGKTWSGQNVFESVYRTKITNQCQLITVTWCKNLLLHGLSVSIKGHEGERQYTCKVEMKPWYFWKKQGSKGLTVDDKAVSIFWDLKAAKFNGEIKPNSEYYVAIVCDEEVVLLLGNLKMEAYRKTGCRPALIRLYPILISRKERIFGKKKFVTRVKFHDKGNFHEISIECKNRNSSNSADSEMEISIDGHSLIHAKHLQWKFRGNEAIHLNKVRIEVYWDVHDWLFAPGLRPGLFIFKPNLLSTPPSSISTSPLSSQAESSSSMEGLNACSASDFCLFLYAWKVE